MPETDDQAIEMDPASEPAAALGFPIVDGFPLNHRLRAEALVAAGLTADPAGHLDDEMIAGTKDRVEAEAEDAKHAEDEAAKAARELRKTSVPDLIVIAQDEGVIIPPDAKKADIVEAIKTNRAGQPDAQNEG